MKKKHKKIKMSTTRVLFYFFKARYEIQQKLKKKAEYGYKGNFSSFGHK